MLKALAKFLSAYLIFALIWQTSFSPLTYSQEATESGEIISETLPLSEATLSAQPQLSPKNNPELDENATPAAQIEVVTDKPGLILGKEYRYQDSGLKLVFTRLPEIVGSLDIQEVKLTPEQVAEFNAFSDIAYDITSDMTNGTFTYDLTLPLPESARGRPVEVKADGQLVNEPKEIKTETITIKSLDHFTLFVLVPVGTEGVADSLEVEVKDSFIRSGPDLEPENKNHNEGASPTLRLQGTKNVNNNNRTRVLVALDLPDDLTDLTKATLILTLALDAKNWGNGTRTIESHRLLTSWTEGNGNGKNSLGNGSGVTWNCAIDTNISNNGANGCNKWGGGSGQPASDPDQFAPATAPAVAINNDLAEGDEVKFDVTQDVLDGAEFGWLIKKSKESQNGQIWFHSKEGSGVPPRLVLEFADPVDNTPPTDPTDILSTSHTINIASTSSQITMSWTLAGALPGATDDLSGVDGYSFYFSNNPDDLPDTSKDKEETDTSVTSVPLADGTWYFHLRTVDNAGNWTSTGHSGPYLIDTSTPASTSTSTTTTTTSTNSDDDDEDQDINDDQEAKTTVEFNPEPFVQLLAPLVNPSVVPVLGATDEATESGSILPPAEEMGEILGENNKQTSYWWLWVLILIPILTGWHWWLRK